MIEKSEKDYNFYTEVPLNVTLGKKIFNCELGVFSLITWDKQWMPTFHLVKYKVNEVKLNDKLIKPDKKLVDAIEFFWQNKQEDLKKSVATEYMMFAWICESQKKQNSELMMDKLT